MYECIINVLNLNSEYILFNRFGINKFEYLAECTMYSLF